MDPEGCEKEAQGTTREGPEQARVWMDDLGAPLPVVSRGRTKRVARKQLPFSCHVTSIVGSPFLP
jgi:hypothetical protein